VTLPFDSESLLIITSAVTFLEALYLIIANPRRIEQASAGLCLGFASLICLSFAGQINPFGLVGGIANWLFAFSAPLFPFAWLLLTTWWGRDVAAARAISTQTVGLFVWFAVALVFTVGLGAESALTFVSTGVAGSYFEISAVNLLLTLFFLVSILFGLYNIENTVRSAVGSQRQKLSFSFNVLIISSAFALFIGSVQLLFEQISLWSILTCALLLPIVGFAFMLSLRHYDPAHLGIVVTRRLQQTSVVIIAGGAFIIVLGVVDALVENYGTLPEITMPAIAATLVGIFFVSVFALDLAQGRAIKDKPLEPSANSELLRSFVEDVSTSANIDEIVLRIGALLDSDHGVNKFALLDTAGHDSFILLEPLQEPRTISHEHINPIAEWMHRYGLPISFDDFCERSGISDEHCRFCTTAIGFSPKVLVPLVCRKRMVGILVTGPSKDGHTDFRELIDFMEIVAAPLSMAIQNSRVTDELVSAKELESYYRVSAFVLDNIKGSSELLEHIKVATVQKTEMPSTDEIDRTIKRLRHVSSKLAVSPADQWTISDIEINSLLREVLDSSGLRSQDRIVVRERFGTSRLVRGDRQRLFSVFENLVSNAVEAMPMGGSLIVSTEQVVDSTDSPAERITFADTGVGMTADFVDSKLFRPFAGTRSKGLGISLYQAREILYQLEGSLTVESTPGRGTSVHVTLRA
jgi:Histidine kinase-, DNA gyrase B-, and HSP90-like ATPase